VELYQFFESGSSEFTSISSETMNISVDGFFELLISDNSVFFRKRHEDSGNMNIDISPWSFNSSPTLGHTR